MDGGLRERKEGTFHDADMTYPLARVENRGLRDRRLGMGKNC